MQTQRRQTTLHSFPNVERAAELFHRDEKPRPGDRAYRGKTGRSMGVEDIPPAKLNELADLETSSNPFDKAELGLRKGLGKLGLSPAVRVAYEEDLVEQVIGYDPEQLPVPSEVIHLDKSRITFDPETLPPLAEPQNTIDTSGKQ